MCASFGSSPPLLSQQHWVPGGMKIGNVWRVSATEIRCILRRDVRPRALFAVIKSQYASGRARDCHEGEHRFEIPLKPKWRQPSWRVYIGLVPLSKRRKINEFFKNSKIKREASRMHFALVKIFPSMFYILFEGLIYGNKCTWVRLQEWISMPDGDWCKVRWSYCDNWTEEKEKEI